METNQNHEESEIDPNTQSIHDILKKAGIKSWMGLPSEEEFKELRLERDRLRQAAAERRAAQRDIAFRKYEREALEIIARKRRNESRCDFRN